MFRKVTFTVHGKSTVKVGEHEIDLRSPLTPLSMYDSILKYTGVDVSEMDETDYLPVKKWNTVDMNLWGEVVDSRAKVETNLIQPTHIYRLPN
jgi:lysyl-tRNA synthetase class 2